MAALLFGFEDTIETALRYRLLFTVCSRMLQAEPDLLLPRKTLNRLNAQAVPSATIGSKFKVQMFNVFGSPMHCISSIPNLEL
jgi:hypothetical protein